MRPTNGARSGSGPVEDLLLVGLVGAAVLTGILYGAAAATARLTGLPAPTGGPAAGVAALAHPSSPGRSFGIPSLNPVLYWGIAIALIGAVCAAGWGVWRVTRVRRNLPVDVRRIDGTATRHEVARAAGPRALLKQARVYRPSLSAAVPKDVGYLLGHSRGSQVWATVEDSMLLIGPPRSGKGAHIVINAILDAPGAVVTTSTRPDTLAVTMKARQRLGPVHVFDPQGLAEGIAQGLRWSPVRGCDDPTTAMIRATGLAASVKYGSVDSGSFWQGKTRGAIQCLLHAAALDGRQASDLYQWSTNPTAARDAVRILAANSAAAPGWADSLESTLLSDPRTRDSIWHGVGLAFDPLADPRVLEAVSPHGGDSLDPHTFLAEHGTLYLLATGSGASSSASLVAALIEDLVEVARHEAARSPRARLDPPLLMALDEIGNLSPLPSLPTLMAEGGGTGITMLPVLQSMAQAREAWGEQNASAIWDAAIVKIILGGGSLTRDLQDVSALLGDRDEYTESTSWDGDGRRSNQRSIRRVPVMSTETLRTMPRGTGLILLRTARPIVADLRYWKTRPDAVQLEAEEASFAQLINRPAAPGAGPVPEQ
jgi:type IV secretion system protein VirD4